jgi:hypothetical protein
MTVLTRSLFQETDHLDLTEFATELFQPGEQFQAVPPIEAFHKCNKADHDRFYNSKQGIKVLMKYTKIVYV